MFAEALIAAIALVAPQEGAEVALLSEAQRSYLALPRAERFERFEDGGYRRDLAEGGDCPRPVELRWRDDATNGVYVVSVDGRETTVSNRCSVRVVNLEPGRAYVWSVRAGGETNAVSGSFTTAADLPRLMLVDGVSNVRDLGGWTTKDGRRVRMNRIYRSAGLRDCARRTGDSLLSVRYEPGERRVTDLGLTTLKEELGIRFDIELRSLKEAMGMESSVIPGARWLKVPFPAYDFVSDDVKGRLQFAKIFREFTFSENYPVLFHCAGGRDRTGTVAFLLNALLGVSEDDLCRDWEVSAFGDSALTFSTGRIQRLMDFLHSLAGEDICEQAESYARSCGISAAEIAAFRAIMLEGGVE